MACKLALLHPAHTVLTPHKAAVTPSKDAARQEYVYQCLCCCTGMRLADGMSKAAVAFLAKQVAAENSHTGQSYCLDFHKRPVFALICCFLRLMALCGYRGCW